MRIWSLHPELLYHEKDCKLYVANWSETLQGLGAIQGSHKMHLNHPQLNRFKQLRSRCLEGLYTYLYYVFEDSMLRKNPSGNSFKFDMDKINFWLVDYNLRIPVSQKQVDFEMVHLNKNRLARGLPIVTEVILHPMFYIDNDYVDIIEKGGRI